MITLAIDTSAAASVALVNSDGHIYHQRTTFSARKHAEFVGPAIRDILDGTPASAQPDRVVVGVGPGPFTGLRSGIATGIGFALGRSIPVFGVRSHDALAYRAHANGLTGELVVATDARRKEVYTTRYRIDKHAVTVIDGPRVILPAELAPHLDDSVTRLGRGFALYSSVLGEPDRTDEEFLEPTAADLGLAAQGTRTDSDNHLGDLLDTSPLYLREPDAQPRA